MLIEYFTRNPDRIAVVHPNWIRLLQIGSVPGWISVIIFVYRVIGHATNIDFILNAVWNSRLIALWNFLQTPDGNIVLVIVGVGWLVALIFWPNRSGTATACARPLAIDPPEIPTDPIPPTAVPVVGKPHLETLDTIQPRKESWIAAEGHVVQLIPDRAGCTAVLKSGQDIIKAQFDETWLWHLGHLKTGTTLSIEGRISSEQTGQQLHLLDCVCPGGIRVRPFSR